MKIQAADADKAVVSLEAIGSDWGLGLENSEGDLVLDGLVLERGKRGLYIKGRSIFELGTLMPVTLEHCTIQNNVEDGVYIVGSAKVTLTNCTIQNNGNHGVVLYQNSAGKPSATLNHCIITDNNYGFSFRYGSQTEFSPVHTLDTIGGSNNRIYGNSLQNLVPEVGWPAGF